MGNISNKCSVYSSIPEKALWKSGEKTESVPAPLPNNTSYDRLSISSTFKDYLSCHLDLDYLVSAILSDGTDSDVFLNGIDAFVKSSSTVEESLMQRISNFELATTAGIDVRVS